MAPCSASGCQSCCMTTVSGQPAPLRSSGPPPGVAGAAGAAGALAVLPEPQAASSRAVASVPATRSGRRFGSGFTGILVFSGSRVSGSAVGAAVPAPDDGPVERGEGGEEHDAE